MPRTPASELRPLINAADDENPGRPASQIVADLIVLNDGEYNPGDEQFVVRSINRRRGLVGRPARA